MKFSLGSNIVGGVRTFVIAEIGNNHNGSYDRAIEMVDLAKNMGVDCVKFQMRHLDKVYRRRSLIGGAEDLGTEYIIDLLNKFELSVEEHRSIFDYCYSKKILYMCTPWDSESLAALESFPVAGYKVASADLTNLPLLEGIAKTKKPLILSTGMSASDEIKKSINFLNDLNTDFAILHCNSTYPAPFEDINLRQLEYLKSLHPCVGYSGHERGTAVSLAAVALGACVIERHFTLDRSMEGPDHAASLEYAEFKSLVDGIRQIELALGKSGERLLTQGELINRENLAKSLVAAKFLKAGTILTADSIKVISPGQGLSPQRYRELLGVKVERDMNEEDFFYESDISQTLIKPKSYLFTRPWGVPVRYHDFKSYRQAIKPDLYEFHLSYGDMNASLEDYLDITPEAIFVVHAPELFSGSHLMDLTASDESYRKLSIHETQRVINITRALKKYFPRATKPLIVVNIGGFTMDKPMTSDEINAHYLRLGDSLKVLDLDGVELIPQTMAPFPWHFGGQRYQNLFINAEDIIKWCKAFNLRICFDVSHSRLAANHFGFDFYNFAKMVAPFVAHIHLGDAKGVNGEGLQIGLGEINFSELGKILKMGCPAASFIPEIWQGHKNFGEGFWIALEKLEGLI